MADDDREYAETFAVLARAAAIGAAAGAVLVVALVLSGSTPRSATALAFSLAALVLGFGVTVWSAVLLLGETLAAAHDALDRDWSAADTRQAMAVLAVAGAAGMVGAVVVSAVLGA
jgi:hypothetical protein